MKNAEHGHEERLGGGLFTPDSLLPSQYFDRVAHGSEHTGERRLMIAILEDAVDMYRKHAGAGDRRRQQLFLEAEEWIEGTDRMWVFSFENICDMLGFDAGQLRHGIRAWKKRAAALERGQVVLLRAEAGSPGELRRASGS